MGKRREQKGKQQVARANGRTVELAVQRALAELDFAPGELAEDQYEVTIIIPPEEGFMGVGAVDAVVEVALVGEEFDFYGPEDDSQPEELLAGLDEDAGRRGSRGRLRPDRATGGLALGTTESEDSPEAARLRAFLSRVLDELGLPARDPHHRGARGAVRGDHRRGHGHPHRSPRADHRRGRVSREHRGVLRAPIRAGA